MRPSRPSRRKSNVRSTYWRELADGAWAKRVRELWPKCAVCGKTPVEAHHLIGRNHIATRHDLKNGLGLCSRCHKFDPILSAHNGGVAFAEWLKKNWPEKYAWVMEHKRDMATPEQRDYKAAYERLKAGH